MKVRELIENVISDGNDIIVTTSNTGDFIYSLDENIYQSSNVFSNVVSGLYTISVTQPNCKSTISLEHWHLYLPKFFTPNNDGFNDLWEITEMKNFPNSSASIYDRYGKLIINLNASNYRWDGTFNNNPLPADDYWYRLKLDNSKPEVKGHFSLKR
jgi:gliding motility-associated-like protein